MIVCVWCHRRIKGVKPQGFAIYGAAYEEASKGGCIECWEDFEEKTELVDLARHERVAASAPRLVR